MQYLKLQTPHFKNVFLSAACSSCSTGEIAIQRNLCINNHFVRAGKCQVYGILVFFLKKSLFLILINVYIINCYSFVSYVITVTGRHNKTRTGFVCETLFFTLSTDMLMCYDKNHSHFLKTEKYSN